MSDIAIAHKDYDVRGGGEILVEQLADSFDWPLYVGNLDVEKVDLSKGIDVHELFPKLWQQAPINHGGIVRSIAYRYLWQQDTSELHDYDTLVLSGNEPLWYVGPDEQTIIAYTHSTPRWMYDLYPTIDNGPLGRLWQTIIEQQRVWYHPHTRKPDLYVANSELVARRINKYWNIPTEQIKIVYPPVDTDRYSSAITETQGYYVTVSRLVDAKRINWLVEQANRLNLNLKIAGTGPQEDALRDMAGDTVDLLGYVSEDRKCELLSGANAFLMTAQNEDFGMTPIEALASGTPVIGVNEGYTKYQIQDGETGVLFDFNAAAFEQAIERFESGGVEHTPKEIEAHAERYSVESFEAGMMEAVETAQERANIEPNYEA